ncbi:MAG: hypothetical protein B6245_06785 [Desulfobacteraceae bacterium 4572_88]|nr:MAG: hypothetical protein B6245_06785 [Desulfobacteraceae bacterium 4572_88]
MKLKPGIAGKLFAWYFVFVLIFFGTILILYANVRQMMEISEHIVNKNYKISSASKKMIENLFSMEEYEKKYLLLKRAEYRPYFVSAQKAFEESLAEIMTLESNGMSISTRWKELNEDYWKFSSESKKRISDKLPETLWIPETVISGWVQKISEARTENEEDVELANRELNRRGQMTVRTGLMGLGISILAGLFGSRFLAHSMIRPLRKLLRGIRSISKARGSEPIHIRSGDEFGELADAFNEMARRLKEEQQMRSDFISMLSHEIRTPLTSIRESVNLIEEGIMGNINDKQRKFLEIANLEIGRVCELLNRLMQVFRMESGVLKIYPRPVDPLCLLTTCLDQIAPSAEAKGTALESQIPPELPQVMGDSKQLPQVLLNILGNAVKFSPPDSKVVVRLESAQDRNKLNFSVSDNGPGIPEEEQSFIFNKYYRAKGVREHMDGVGLGLSISKRIIEAHGGSVWVTSRMGEGSTFGFSLPIA